jgi:hypothetical protein
MLSEIPKINILDVNILRTNRDSYYYPIKIYYIYFDSYNEANKWIGEVECAFRIKNETSEYKLLIPNTFLIIKEKVKEVELLLRKKFSHIAKNALEVRKEVDPHGNKYSYQDIYLHAIMQ